MHKLSGYTGKVIGYGHRMIDGAYQPTIRVNVTYSLSANRLTIVEDLISLWERVEQTFK